MFLSRKSILAIWQEILLANGQNRGYEGVAFDDPYSIRNAIWVSYASSGSSYTAQQDRTYDAKLWEEFDLAFHMLDVKCTQEGYPRMIKLYRSPRWKDHGSVTWVLMFTGTNAHPEGIEFVAQCLKCVERAMECLYAPMENLVS